MKTPYKINSNSFTNMSLQSSYWAGYLAADGCLKTRDKNIVQLCVSKVDTNHLLKFNKFLQTDRQLSISKKYNHAYLTITDKQIRKDLENIYQLKPQKSLTIQFPNLKYYNKISYIIGYIDGDGSIGYNKSKVKGVIYKYIRLRIIGTYSFLNHIRLFLNIQPKPIVHCNSKIHILSCSNKNTLKSLFDFANEFELPILKRKWSKVNEL